MLAKYFARLWIGFLTGVAIGSWLLLDSALLLVLISAVLIMVGLAILSRHYVIIFLVIGLIFGLWYINQSFRDSEYSFGQDIDVEGIVVQDPPQVDHSQPITILPDGKTQALRATLYQPVSAHQGDRVWIRGAVQPPENFDDFDYIGYLQRYNIYSVLKKPRVIVLRSAPLHWNTALLQLKYWLLNKSRIMFPQQAGNLIVGMLIGQQGNLPQNVKDDFSRTGLSHVVAVSGFNMTIIATVCTSLAWYIGRRPTNYLTVLIIFAFVIITGATASVVRAAVMALLVVSAQLFGRLYSSSYAIIWAAGLMVLFNPRLLAWDIGFQLSMAATIGVLAIYSKARADSGLKNILLPTIGAIIMTAPIIAFYFQTFSLIAPLANALLLPLVPWIMLFGAISFLPIIGTGFSGLAATLANFFLSAVHILAAPSFSSVKIAITPLEIIIYYSIVYLLFHFWKRKS